MKNLLLSLSIGMFLGSTSMASGANWHCKERLQECLNSGKGAVACSDQHDRCNGPRKPCRKVAEKAFGHTTLSPFHSMLWPFSSVYAPFSSIGSTRALDDCCESDRDSF